MEDISLSTSQTVSEKVEDLKEEDNSGYEINSLLLRISDDWICSWLLVSEYIPDNAG